MDRIGCIGKSKSCISIACFGRLCAELSCLISNFRRTIRAYSITTERKTTIANNVGIVFFLRLRHSEFGRNEFRFPSHICFCRALFESLAWPLASLDPPNSASYRRSSSAGKRCGFGGFGDKVPPPPLFFCLVDLCLVGEGGYTFWIRE